MCIEQIDEKFLKGLSSLATFEVPRHKLEQRVWRREKSYNDSTQKVVL